MLHQKLQMLNCCIERKKSRELALNIKNVESDESSTDDEEFYDCDEEVTKTKEKYSLWNKPVGRLAKFENVKLLTTGDTVYVPAMQEPVPKTEDELEEDTDILLKLGCDPEGSELRARMMSASLLSDMESFKAANPKAVLEDFIRWYSPRDWIEDEGVDEWKQPKGHLSSRMLIAGNTWVEMWKAAKPVPAHRQKRLFDDTTEAEKVLRYLELLTMGQVINMLLPTVVHAGVRRLNEECEQINSPDCTKALDQISNTVKALTREATVAPAKYELLIQEMASLENLISQINSLLYKFNPEGNCDDEMKNFARQLVQGYEKEVTGTKESTLGKRLMSLFADAQNEINLFTVDSEPTESSPLRKGSVFPEPAQREFVLRASTPRPAASSASCLQYMRAIVSKNEFRLAGAFAEDIIFF